MSSTTTPAIRASIVATIKGLAPAAKHFRHNTYREASPTQEWKDRPGADIDREFTVEAIQATEAPVMFGMSTENDYSGVMTIKIGHAKTANRNDGVDRRDADLHQIAANLEKSANFPTGVFLIRRQSWDSADFQELYWLTTMKFFVNFTMTAP